MAGPRPSQFVKSSFPYLIILLENLRNKDLRTKLLRRPDVILALSELTLNILKENIPLTKKDKNSLNRYREELLCLVRKKQAPKYRILTGQKGAGLLSSLLTVGLPILTSLLFQNGTNN